MSIVPVSAKLRQIADSHVKELVWAALLVGLAGARVREKNGRETPLATVCLSVCLVPIIR